MNLKQELIERYGPTNFDNPFSEELWKDNYKDYADQNVTDTIFRVASAIASQEKDPDYWTEQFFCMLSNFMACPGGRINANAGTQWNGTTMFNCFTGPKAEYDLDSIDGIYQTLLYQAKTLKSEGGWGMNFSFIRPRGSFIKGIGSESPGAVKFMEIFDKSSEIITHGSGTKKKNAQGKEKIRKGAQMGELNIWHPDIEEFIFAKLTPGRLTKFNISVNCTNKFMDLILKIESLKESGASQEEIDEVDKWDLIFPDTTHKEFKSKWYGSIENWQKKGYPVIVYKTVKATELFEKIVTSTYTRNDPGIQFMDIANHTHLWNYGDEASEIDSSNPCGEQMMPPGSACDLASLNLTKFIYYNELGHPSVRLEHIKECGSLLTRFLDNVNDISMAPLDIYMSNIKKRRRIGIGIMGWGSLLFMMKIRYGSEQAEALKQEIMETLCYSAISESVNLSREKGMFEGCDPEKLADHPYFDLINLPDDIRAEIRKYGMRNSSLFSIQPTGNTGIYCGVISGGLEPIFLPQYIRTMIIPRCPDQLLDKAPKYWEGQFHETEWFKLTKEGDDEILVAQIDDVKYKIDRNRGLTREILCEDYGVRYLKSRNEWDPEADYVVTTDKLSVEEHLRDMKGWAKWIDSSISKTINVPNKYSYEDFRNIYLDTYCSGVIKGITTYRAGTMTSVLKAVDEELNDEPHITDTVAPKRPDMLPCDIIHSTISGEKWTTFIGLLNDRPYEIFGGLSEHVELPKKYKTGYILKRKCEKANSKGRMSCYDLVIGEGEERFVVKDIAVAFNDVELAWATRAISTMLRHGVPVSIAVDQLSKDMNSNFQSFSKVIARQLKKYVVDGTSSGESCPECGSKLIFQEGCHLCLQCGSSKCS